MFLHIVRGGVAEKTHCLVVFPQGRRLFQSSYRLLWCSSGRWDRREVSSGTTKLIFSSVRDEVAMT